VQPQGQQKHESVVFRLLGYGVARNPLSCASSTPHLLLGSLRSLPFDRGHSRLT